jgi:hypothetical protein
VYARLLASPFSGVEGLCVISHMVSLSTHHAFVTILSVTVKDLCRRAKITRQWLNKLVDRGEVQGCRRKPNDRLLIIEGPDLDRWIQQIADVQKQKRGRRLTLKDRLDRFRKMPDSPEYTVGNLAKKVGLSRKQIGETSLRI